MKLADLERHLRHNGCVLYRRVLPIVFGSTHRCTRSPASRAIAKSRKGRCGPSASNWKFRCHKIYRIEKRKTPPLRDTNPQGWATQRRVSESSSGHPSNLDIAASK